MAQSNTARAAVLLRPPLRQAAVVLLVILAVLVLAVLVGVSPLVLDMLSGDDERWNRLSQIGQTYGAASALLAALALGGIVVSLILQLREYRANREQALRLIHTDLLRMAMEDPVYRRSWGPFFASADPDRQREHMYLNLIVSNLQMRWELGALSEHHLRTSIGVVFSGEPGHRFWATVRELRARAISGRRERRFHQILDEEFHRAMPPEGPSTEEAGGTPAEEPTAEPAPASTGPTRRSRRWWLLLGGGATAAAAGGWLRWARSRK